MEVNIASKIERPCLKNKETKKKLLLAWFFCYLEPSIAFDTIVLRIIWRLRIALTSRGDFFLLLSRISQGKNQCVAF